MNERLENQFADIKLNCRAKLNITMRIRHEHFYGQKYISNQWYILLHDGLTITAFECNTIRRHYYFIRPRPKLMRWIKLFTAPSPDWSRPHPRGKIRLRFNHCNIAYPIWDLGHHKDYIQGISYVDKLYCSFSRSVCVIIHRQIHTDYEYN